MASCGYDSQAKKQPKRWSGSCHGENAVPAQPAPHTAWAGGTAHSRSPPDCTAGTPLCTAAPASCICSPACPTDKGLQDLSPSGALVGYLLCQAAQRAPVGHEGPPWWSGGPGVVSVSFSWPAGMHPAWSREETPAHMHVDCSKASSLRFRVHFSHLFMHAPLPKAPPGCRVPSPSSWSPWHPPYQEEGVGWGSWQLLGPVSLPSTCDGFGQCPPGSMRKQQVFCACILLTRAVKYFMCGKFWM